MEKEVNPNSENTFISSKEQSPNIQPFEIRAHRLQTIYLEAKLFNENGIDKFSDKLKKHTTELRKGALLGNDYHIDILGQNPTRMDVISYNKNMIEFAEKLVALKDSAPIKLTRKPDGICQLCAIGNHCINKQHEMNPDQKYESTDEYQMEEFISVAKGIGLKEGDAFVVNYRLRYNKPYLDSLSTDKKTLVKVLENWDDFKKKERKEKKRLDEICGKEYDKRVKILESNPEYLKLSKKLQFQALNELFDKVWNDTNLE